MYLSDVETDFNTCLMPAHTIESDPIESSYPSMIWLTSESSSFVGSRVSDLRRGCGFICTWVVPRDHGCARGGHGDASGRIRNNFVPY